MAEQLPPSKLRVFLCHSSGDKAQIRALYHKLQAEFWIQPWLDEEDITAGLKWRNEIEKAVKESHVILVCLSPTSITKEGFVQREIKIALDRADYMPEGTIYIIPFKLEACEIPDRLSDLHWVNYFEERGHERLLKALRLRANELGIQLDSVGPSVVTAAKPAVEPKRTTPAPVPQPPPIEQNRLLRELTEPRTTHPRRLEIGQLLNKLGDTRPGVGVQLDGTPDMVWLPVAPGGKSTIEKQTFAVPPFYIAKYQITNAQYQAFYQAHDGYNNPRWWRDMPTEYQPQGLDNPRTATLNNPRDNVSWYQSVAFARWLHSRLKDQELLPIEGKSFRIGQNAQVRLPTEWEWQWAAQGGLEGRETSGANGRQTGQIRTRQA